MLVNLIVLGAATFFMFISLVFLFVYRERQNEKLRSIGKPSISIIIPVLDEEKTIEGTVKSLRNASKKYKGKVEIIVVDNGSTDGTIKILKKLKVAYYNNPIKSKGISVNLGVKKAKGEFVGVIDADSFVEEDIFKKMLPYFKDKKVGAVFANIVPKNNKSFFEKYQGVEYAYQCFIRQSMDSMNGMYMTPGGGMPIYRRAVFASVKGYSGKEMLCEDMEIGLKIVKQGYRIRVAKDAKVYTVVPSTLHRFYRQRLRWTRGTIQALTKHNDMMVSSRYSKAVFYLLQLIPLLLLVGLVLIINFFYTLVTNLSNYFDTIRLMITNSYFPTIILPSNSIDILFIINPTYIFVVLGFLIWLYLFAQGLKISGKKMSKNFLIGFIGIFIYPFFNIYVWGTAFYNEFRKKENRWW